MKNAYKLILVTTCLVILFLAGYIAFRGRLSISASPTPFDVTLEQKEYKNVSSFSKKVVMGRHKIKVSKALYKDFVTTVSVSPFKTINLNPTLDLSKEGEGAISLANFVAKEWINYTSSKNLDLFVLNLSDRLTPEYLNILSDSLRGAVTPNSQGIVLDIQSVYGPIEKSEIKRSDDKSAEITVYVNKKSEDISVSRMDMKLVKNGSSWLIDGIIYNY